MSFFTRNDSVHNISEYCKRCGWKLAQIQANGASLIFTMPSGREQYLYLVPYQSTIEFSVPSVAAFASLSEVPHGLSTTLLERNAQQRIGFWCIEDIGGYHVYSYMHNAEMELLSVDYFAAIVRDLIQECEQFEQQFIAFVQGV